MFTRQNIKNTFFFPPFYYCRSIAGNGVPLKPDWQNTDSSAPEPRGGKHAGGGS